MGVADVALCVVRESGGSRSSCTAIGGGGGDMAVWLVGALYSF